MTRSSAFGLFAALSLAIAAASPAQQGEGRAVLAGTVVDSADRPVAGAEIFVLDAVARTDTLGSFRLRGVPAGTHEVVVRHVGYLPLTVRLAVVQADTARHRLVLVRIVALDSVRVTSSPPWMAEFEARRATYAGRFVTRAELDKSPNKRLSEILRRMPGLRLLTNRQNRSEVYAVSARTAAASAGSTPRCYLHVWIDDAPMFTGGAQMPYSLSSLYANEIEGIEYYLGGASVPAKYNRVGATCGVVVIWTRR